jgi:hypothetical protein
MADTAVSGAEPIACTLGPDDARDRYAAIAELNREALRSYERRGRVLELRYAVTAIERVRVVVRQEKECCSFLTFGLHDDGNELRLLITAPETAGAAVDALFDQFIVSAEGGGCACAATSQRKPRVSGKAVGGVALVSAAGAVAACAACALPFAVPAVLLAGTGGVLAWLDHAHVWITVAAVAALAVAWFWIWRQSRRSRARPAMLTLAMMVVATLLVTSAVFWPELAGASAESSELSEH